MSEKKIKSTVSSANTPKPPTNLSTALRGQNAAITQESQSKSPLGFTICRMTNSPEVKPQVNEFLLYLPQGTRNIIGKIRMADNTVSSFDIASTGITASYIAAAKLHRREFTPEESRKIINANAALIEDAMQPSYTLGSMKSLIHVLLTSALFTLFLPLTLIYLAVRKTSNIKENFDILKHTTMATVVEKENWGLGFQIEGRSSITPINNPDDIPKEVSSKKSIDATENAEGQALVKKLYNNAPHGKAPPILRGQTIKLVAQPGLDVEGWQTSAAYRWTVDENERPEGDEMLFCIHPNDKPITITAITGDEKSVYRFNVSSANEYEKIYKIIMAAHKEKKVLTGKEERLLNEIFNKKLANKYQLTKDQHKLPDQEGQMLFYVKPNSKTIIAKFFTNRTVQTFSITEQNQHKQSYSIIAAAANHGTTLTLADKKRLEGVFYEFKHPDSFNQAEIAKALGGTAAANKKLPAAAKTSANQAIPTKSAENQNKSVSKDSNRNNRKTDTFQTNTERTSSSPFRR